MLHFNNRFHGYNSLRFVYKNGYIERSQFLVVKSVKNPRRSSPRVAIVVSKKIHKGAVGRNRIRRRLYEIVRFELATLNPHSDIVCIVSSRDVMNMSAVDLKTCITDMFLKSGLYKTDAKNDTIF